MFCTQFTKEVLSTIIDNWLAIHDVPERVVILAKKLVANKSRTPHVMSNVKKPSQCSSVFFDSVL